MNHLPSRLFEVEGMDIQSILDNTDIVLTEAAVIETLRRSGDVILHPRLENALLIYDETGKSALSNLYQGFISVAHKADVPIIICTPTWRANHERLAETNIANNVNADAVKFLKQLRETWGTWAANIFIGGQIGCKNDCYKPAEALSKEDAKEFHLWQVHQLAKAGVDFLFAATVPASPEAAGIAVAMTETNIPFIISFVINREGRILDGNSLEKAFNEIDAICSRPPLGYMINCAYPSFLNAHKHPHSVLARLIGFQANASSRDHAELDGAAIHQADEISDWGDRMIALNRKFGVKILGGCCGTRREHLQYIVRHLIRQS
jgi:S-methylmethionine-dependent homocysteine/selenocysteine methylase